MNRHSAANGRIAGIVTAVPSRIVTNADCPDPVAADEAAKLTGVRERRWVREGQSAYDLNLAAAKALMQRIQWHGSELDVIVYVTQTPSRAVPADVYSLAAELGATCPCVQVNYSCSGYVYGLWIAMQLLTWGQRGIVVVGDANSTLSDPGDRGTAPLFGDAGSATAVEINSGDLQFFSMGCDGTGAQKLCTVRHYEHMHAQAGRDLLAMDGGAVFNFTLKALPALVQSLPPADLYLLHQSNAFMMKHLARKCGIPLEKVPLNIERFGNTSCASIPLLICDPQAGVRFPDGGRVQMLGYGAGWAWAGASITTQPLQVQDLIEV